MNPSSGSKKTACIFLAILFLDLFVRALFHHEKGEGERGLPFLKEALRARPEFREASLLLEEAAGSGMDRVPKGSIGERSRRRRISSRGS